LRRVSSTSATVNTRTIPPGEADHDRNFDTVMTIKKNRGA
jgi:hypothetical protein